MKLTQTEIDKKSDFRCKHGHNGFSHPKCYATDNRIIEKIGFADIEASNLKATFGIVYTYCIKAEDTEKEKGKMIKRTISVKDLYNGIFDKNLLLQFIEDAQEFDRLIFHYGGDFQFDLPFLRTRAVKWGLPFPKHKTMCVSDTYPILKKKFKLHSNRLETACGFFDIPAKEHKLNPEVWLDMLTGNPKKMKKSLAYILKHNEEDVISLEMLWQRIKPYVRLSNTSI